MQKLLQLRSKYAQHHSFACCFSSLTFPLLAFH